MRVYDDWCVQVKVKVQVCRFVSDHWAALLPGWRKRKSWPGSVSSALSAHQHSLFQSGAGELGEPGWWRLRSLVPPAAQLANLPPRAGPPPSPAPLSSPAPPSLVATMSGRRLPRQPAGSAMASAVALRQKRDGLSAIPKQNKKSRMGRRRVRKASLPQGTEQRLESDSVLEKEEDQEMVKSRDPFRPTVAITYQSRQSGRPIPALAPSQQLFCLEDNSTIDSPVAAPWDSHCDLQLDTVELMKTDMSDLLASPDLPSLPGFPSNSSNEVMQKQILPAEEREVMVAPVRVKEEMTDCDIKIGVQQKEEDGVGQDLSEEKGAAGRGRAALARLRGEAGLDCLVATGSPLTSPSTSPYSGRRLLPYIRRDTETTPAKLALLRSIQVGEFRFWCLISIFCLQARCREGGKQLLHPVDFCYVQPGLVGAASSLARLLFWPGIDLTESLQWPEFSCVVLYRRLCIGIGNQAQLTQRHIGTLGIICPPGFLTPDTRWSESYLTYFGVHPEWRGQGIGSFILYHLAMVSRGRDLTLHVAADNPAAILYQKFGFKVEEFVRNFYDKFLPESHPGTRHALYLRLSR